MPQTKFFEGYSPFGLTARVLKMAFFTVLHMGVLYFASSRAIKQGDTDWLSGLLLLICMVCTSALLIESIKVMRSTFRWSTVLYLIFSLFNFVYFFYIFVCCVPMVGSF